MKNKFFSKFGNNIRRAFCGMLCLVVVFQSFVVSNALNGSYDRYEWTRISSYEELLSYVEQANDKDAGRRLVQQYDGGLSGTEGWFKVLIAYKASGSDDSWYFISGQSTCEDGKRFSASRMLDSYGMKPVKTYTKKFTTNGGYLCPYIKFNGYVSGTSFPTFYLRFSNTNDENMSDRALIGNMSWCGIINHAINYSAFRVTSASSPSSYAYGAAINSTGYYDFAMQWVAEEGGSFRPFYRTSKGDRLWSYSDSNNEIEVCKNKDTAKTRFQLYIGRSLGASAVGGTLSVDPGYTTTYNNIVLTANGTIEVPKNAYLVIGGDNNINNGRIIVNGGILVVKGVFDTIKMDENSLADDTGSITIKNGGTLIVEDDGLIVARYGTSNLYLENGSTAVISGTCAIGGKISISNSTLYVREGGAIIHGKKVCDSVVATTVSKDNLYENRGRYLDAFVENLTSRNSVSGALELLGLSYFECEGLYFRNTGIATYINPGSGLDIIEHNNMYASIQDMMRTW